MIGLYYFYYFFYRPNETGSLENSIFTEPLTKVEKRFDFVSSYYYTPNILIMGYFSQVPGQSYLTKLV